MKTILTLLLSLLLIQLSIGQELKIDFPYIKEVDYKGEFQEDYARYGICQFRYEMADTTHGLKTIKDVEATKKRIRILVENAVRNEVNVLVFPELALAFDQKNRDEVLTYLQEVAKTYDMIIIGGSFYNEQRENTVPIILPTQTQYSYKIKQSRFEVSPLYDEGMKRGDTLVVISSKYGKILPIVCVDLISDEVQFMARYFSNKNKINTLINLTYNPAGPEFMREMSAIVKRHRMFGLISNVSSPTGSKSTMCKENGFGNSAAFATLVTQHGKVTKLISDCFKDVDKKNLLPAYSTLVSQIGPETEGMIILDLNLSTVRTPKRTNAPDQGYPTIQNLHVITIEE